MQDIKQIVSTIPQSPGVYFFRGAKRKIIYVGKAKNLRKRVKQYFLKNKNSAHKIHALVENIKDITWEICSSEIDALIQEAHYIKKYNPKFNVVLRDDKNYFFVGITKTIFPRIFITHQTKNEQNKTPAQYIGPFTEGFALKETLKMLRNIFPYRHCRILPKKPCLQYHLGRCLAPCKYPQEQTQVRKNIRNIIGILNGNRQAIMKKLEISMRLASRKEQFAQAQKYKKQIENLKKIFAHSMVLARFKENLKNPYKWIIVQRQMEIFTKRANTIQRVEAYDISNISGKFAVGSMVVFENGEPAKKEYRKFKIKFTDTPDDPRMMAEMLMRRIKHTQWQKADLILIDGGTTQLNAVLTVIPKKQLIISLAKQREEVYLPNKKIPLLASTIGKEFELFARRIRDEAHRFAIIYHRKLRDRKALK